VLLKAYRAVKFNDTSHPSPAIAPRARLAFFLPGLEVGGTERALAALLRGLPPERFDVHVICLSGFGPLEEEVRSTGAHLFDLGYARRTTHGNQWWRTAASLPGVIQRLVRFLRHERIEIFHTMIPACNIYGAVAACLAGVPHLCCSKLSLANYRDSSRLLAAAESITDRWFQLVHCKSLGIVEDVARREPIPRERMRVIYNGIQIDDYLAVGNRTRIREEFGAGPATFLLGVVANLNAYKGHSDLIAAIRLCSETIPHLSCVFIGRDDGIGPELQRKIDAAQLQDRIRLVGARSDIPEVMSGFDALVSASHEEGFSNVILEAMASALPVIATRVGGNPEAVEENVTGLLVEPRNIEQMAAAIQRLAVDPHAARKMGERGRDRVRALFSNDAYIQGMLGFYDELLKG
jgi:glycosyltransferase involved in cell wall biosynthesis